MTDGTQRTTSLLHSLSQVFRWHKQRKNRLEPLRQWICDHCRRRIERPSDGWVEWLSDPDGSRSRGFRLVHHDASSPLRPASSCEAYSDRPERNALRSVIDETSLMDFIVSPHYLLSLASPGPYVERHYSGPRVADLDEWAELPAASPSPTTKRPASTSPARPPPAPSATTTTPTSTPPTTCCGSSRPTVGKWRAEANAAQRRFRHQIVAFSRLAKLTQPR